MKLLFIALSLLLLAVSCALTDDFEFTFVHNGHEFEGMGTSAIPAIAGDTLKIKLPKYPTRKCTAIVIDGNNHIKKSCKGKKGTFVTYNLGEVNPRTLKTIAMTLVRKGSETKSGKLYLGIANAGYDPTPIEYDCPLQSEIGNQYTCMRPAHFSFIISIYPQYDGTLQIYAPRCAGISIKEVFEVVAGQELNFTIENNGEGYCPVRIDFKGELKQSLTLHVDFYKI